MFSILEVARTWLPMHSSCLGGPHIQSAQRRPETEHSELPPVAFQRLPKFQGYDSLPQIRCPRESHRYLTPSLPACIDPCEAPLRTDPPLLNSSEGEARIFSYLSAEYVDSILKACRKHTCDPAYDLGSQRYRKWASARVWPGSP